MINMVGQHTTTVRQLTTIVEQCTTKLKQVQGTTRYNIKRTDCNNSKTTPFGQDKKNTSIRYQTVGQGKI